MASLYRDPLFHFLAAGLIIFFLLGQLSPSEQDEQIIVDRASLLTFIQYRSRAFEPAAAEALLSSMSDEDRNRLIDDYLQEEALYREAMKLGLDDGDYVIRRRMVQKLEFMAEAAIGERAFTDDELRDHYESNRNDYALPARLTFSHVFLSEENRDEEVLMGEAARLMDELHNAEAQFEDATRYGDRFLFHTNYVDRTRDYVASHLGADATAALFNDETPLNAWSGPFRSKYGAHLVYLTDRKQGSIAPFAEAQTQVEADLRRAALEEERQSIIADVIASYDPLIADDLASTPQNEPQE